MEEKTLHILEFDKVIAQLAGFATSEAGRELCLRLTPSQNPRKVREWLRNTTDAAERIRLKGQSLSFRGVKQLSDSLARLSVSAALSAAELLAVSSLLTVADRAQAYGQSPDSEERRDSLTDLFMVLNPLPQINRELKRCILSEDEIADDASSELSRIRGQQKQAAAKIHDSLSGLINSYRDYLSDAVVTQRDGRYCLPVRAESKAKVPGIVHDTSSTGMTLFIEPGIIVKLNNDIRELEIAEKKEIERILEDLSLSLAPYVDDLKENILRLRQLDMIFAKALYSASLDAAEPKLNTDRHFVFRSARHPLIAKDKVVPVDIELGGDYDLLVITGPNTGGKTVSLKTAGLLTLMGQAGLHIPASEGSELAVFKDVYADIGDEQSIEQSLSTFSAHMINIVGILDKADPDSLCLFDELGSGTDPTEGAALAMAILTFLHNMQVRCIATTHYSEIKIWALRTGGVENASCEFDINTLSPTYRLITGIPGKSNAFAISRRLGLPEYIIDEAQKYIESEDESFEEVIAGLNDARAQMEKDRRVIESSRLEIEELKKRIREKESRLDERREKYLEDARAEAQKILKEAKDTADSTVRNISRIASQHGGMLSPELEAEREKLRSGLKKTESAAKLKVKGPSKPVSAKKLKVGDGVRVTSMGGMKGTLSSLPDRDGNIFVQLGIMKSKVNVKDIELLSESELGSIPGRDEKPGRGGGGSFSPKALSVSTELNLIGMTTDEAIPQLEKYLDDAYLAHLPQVRIVHGRGTGALREAVHKRLKKLSYVAGFRLGEHGEGDNGVTVVKFK